MDPDETFLSHSNGVDRAQQRNWVRVRVNIYSERAQISKKEASKISKCKEAEPRRSHSLRKATLTPQFGILDDELLKFVPVPSIEAKLVCDSFTMERSDLSRMLSAQHLWCRMS